jgi:hypothetical protein
MKIMQYYNKLCDGFLISFAADSTIKMSKSKFNEVISAALGLYTSMLYRSRSRTLQYTVTGVDKVSDPMNMIATEVAFANYPVLNQLAEKFNRLYQAYTSGVKFRAPETDPKGHRVTFIYKSDSPINENVFNLLVEIYKDLSSFGQINVSEFKNLYSTKMNDLIPRMSGTDQDVTYDREAKRWVDSFNYKRYQLLNNLKFYKNYDDTLPEFSEPEPRKTDPSRLMAINFTGALKVPAYKAALEKIGLNTDNIKHFSFGYANSSEKEVRPLDKYLNSLFRTTERNIIKNYVTSPNQNMLDRQNALLLIVAKCVKIGSAIEPEAYGKILEQARFEQAELEELKDMPTPGTGEGNILFSARTPKKEPKEKKEETYSVGDNVFYKTDRGIVERAEVFDIVDDQISIVLPNAEIIENVSRDRISKSEEALESTTREPRSPLPISPILSKDPFPQPASPYQYEGMASPPPWSPPLVGIDESSTPVAPVAPPTPTKNILELNLDKPFKIGEKVTYINQYGEIYDATIKNIKEEEVSSPAMMGMKQRTIKRLTGITIEYTNEKGETITKDLGAKSTDIIRQEKIASSLHVLYSLANESPLLVASFIKRYVKTKVRG